MALIVQKFGGSSVKDRDRIFNVARIVANTHNAGNDVVVVVSAQGDTTDDLIAKAGEITHNPSAREMDMLLASGEQISISLLAMALNELGCHAISLTGWQAGFRTDRAYTKARITRLETPSAFKAMLLNHFYTPNTVFVSRIPAAVFIVCSIKVWIACWSYPLSDALTI